MCECCFRGFSIIFKFVFGIWCFGLTEIRRKPVVDAKISYFVPISDITFEQLIRNYEGVSYRDATHTTISLIKLHSTSVIIFPSCPTRRTKDFGQWLYKGNFFYCQSLPLLSICYAYYCTSRPLFRCQYICTYAFNIKWNINRMCLSKRSYSIDFYLLRPLFLYGLGLSIACHTLSNL